jgi:hypothetical protein
MRRIVATMLVVFGAGLIVLTLAWVTYIEGKEIKFPLTVDKTATVQATKATYFSPKTLSEQTGVTLQVTASVKNDPQYPGTSSTDVWEESALVVDVTHHVKVATQSRVFAFDRKTAQLVQCCGESIDGKPVPQAGIGYVFPMGTQRKTYMVFDTTLMKQMPFTYSGTATVDGIPTYKFVESYGLTKTGTTPFFGNLLGSSSQFITVPEYASLESIFYVDPATGASIKVSEHETTVLSNPATRDSVTVFDGTFTTTPASVAYVAGLDRNGRADLIEATTTVPIGAGIGGAILLTAGIVLSLKRRRPKRSAEYSELL